MKSNIVFAVHTDLLCYRVPLHITCFGALLVHYKESGVYEAACDAIFTLVDGNGEPNEPMA